MRDDRGFALLAVMLVLALLGVIVAEFAFAMRLEASMVRAYRDTVVAEHLTEAGLHQAVREILTAAQVVGIDGEGQLTLHRVAPGQTAATPVPALPRARVPLGGGDFSYRIADEEGRLNLNTAPPDRVERLLAAIGIDRQTRDTVNDALQDWRDANDEHRVSGAESDDFYLRLPVPHRARNANLTDPRELLQLRGVTRELFFGERDRPGLGDLVTTWGRATVNVNTAPAPVLAALGLSEAEITDILQSRARGPYTAVPPRFAGRGLAVGSLTFRIEVEGRVEGEPRGRLVAVVRRSSGAPGRLTGEATVTPGAQVLSWRRAPR